MPEQLQEPEKSEKVFKPVDIVIIEPEEGKNFIIGIRDENCTRDQREVYSTVIPEVLEESGLGIPDDIGIYKRERGTKLWEISGETTREYLEKLIPQIHQAAADYVDVMFGMRSDIKNLVS